MPENKTQFTGASVEDYLAAQASAAQRADGAALMALFERVTGQPPRMFGPSIVGHGTYRYTYESGRTGEAPLAGFAICGRELVVYLSCEGEPQQALLRQGGPAQDGRVLPLFQTAGRPRPVRARKAGRRFHRGDATAVCVTRADPSVPIPPRRASPRSRATAAP